MGRSESKGEQIIANCDTCDARVRTSRRNSCGQHLKKASKTCLSRGTKAEELAIVSPWGVTFQRVGTAEVEALRGKCELGGSEECSVGQVI